MRPHVGAVTLHLWRRGISDFHRIKIEKGKAVPTWPLWLFFSEDGVGGDFCRFFEMEKKGKRKSVIPRGKWRMCEEIDSIQAPEELIFVINNVACTDLNPDKHA